MKKLLLCSLAAVMILSFAACTNGTDDKKDDQTAKQSQTGLQQGSKELVPEWVDGQEYPQGEPVDDGAANQQSSGNQTEEPDENDIAPDEADGKSTYQVGEPIWED